MTLLKIITIKWWSVLLLLAVAGPLRAQPSLQLKGTVVSETGELLAGVTVTYNIAGSGEKQTVLTNEKGIFISGNLREGIKYDFVFSHIGYEEQKLPAYRVNGKDNNSILIRLKPAATNLTDFVVVGYGNQQKNKVTSAITSVKVDNIDKGSSYDPLKYLQGRAAGVNILTPSGTPGAKPVVMIRGIGSISGGSSPLYVIDGVPTEIMPNLNPGDIASIEVLKDASSAAIYGSRANSGVIIITLKSGREGKTTVDITAHKGAGTIYHDIKMANSSEYTAVMQEAVKNYNAQKGTAISLYIPPSIQETNWVKAISRESANTAVVNINFSGGNKTTSNFTSFGYYGQQGILKNSNYNQYNFRTSTSRIISPMLALHTNISGSYTNQRLLEEANTGLKVLYTAREEQPWYGPYNADGSYRVNGVNGIIRHNPVMLINEETWTRSTYEGVGRLSLDFTPLKGLKYTPSISAYGFIVDEHKKLTDKMVARSLTSGWGAVLQDRNLSLRYVLDNVLSYTNKAGKLEYTVLAGHSFEKYSNDKLGMYSSNYANAAYPSANLDVVNAGTNLYPDVIGFDSYDLESYFGRLNMDYNGRYMLNASLRSDGSSRFTQNRRYGYFPSVSLGWNITRESFMQQSKLTTVLSDLKLRASYGVTGSLAGIGNYANQSLVSGGNSYNNQGGLIVSQSAQNVTWEKAGQADLGIDAQFLKGRFGLTADYFYQKTTNLLYNKPIYATSGYTAIAANIGSLENKGLELNANAKILTGKVKWEASVNISFVNNRLLSLYNGSSMYAIPATGSNLLGGGIGVHALMNSKPISAFYMKKQTGIYQSDSDVPAKLYAKGVRAGDMIYEDINKDGDITDDDRQYVGKATPDYYGGFTTSVSYKGFELGLFGQFSVGGKVFASWKGASPEGIEHLGNVYSTATLDDGTKVEQFYGIDQYAATHYWKGPGTSNFMPRPLRGGAFSGYTNGYNMEPSTHFLEDASYLRIKTLTLAYHLPANSIGRWGIKGLRVFVSVDNVWTITKYDGYDPEQSYVANPGDPNYGVDFGLQSSLRTVLTGIDIKF